MTPCEYQSKLEAYLDRALSATEIKEFARHARECASCQTQLQKLQELESLYKNYVDTALGSPPPHYWETVTNRIMLRIGVPEKRSIIAALFDEIGHLLARRSFQFGFGAAVAAILVALLLNWQETQTPSVAEHQEKQSSEESLVTAPPAQLSDGVSEMAKVDAPPSEVEAEKRHNANQDASVVAEQGPETRKPDLVVSSKIIADRQPIEIPARRIRGLAASDVAEELTPLPSPDFIIASQNEDGASEAQDISSIIAASNVTDGAKPRPVDGKPAELELTEQRSDFAETLWIVQESKTLSEKKSIWLSYIAREGNNTYRAMGIYRLALVMASIAEQTRDHDDAREAIEFFKEHERSLRSQMNGNRYDRKLHALQLILEY